MTDEYSVCTNCGTKEVGRIELYELTDNYYDSDDNVIFARGALLDDEEFKELEAYLGYEPDFTLAYRNTCGCLDAPIKTYYNPRGE